MALAFKRQEKGPFEDYYDATLQAVLSLLTTFSCRYEMDAKRSGPQKQSGVFVSLT